MMMKTAGIHVLILSVLMTVSCGGSANADDPKTAKAKTVEMTVTPQAAAPEILRLRLMPLDSERTPGDAVPIYLRLSAERKDEALKEINDKSTAWLDGPLADLPTKDVEKFLDRWSSPLKQLEFAARRKTAEWNYTLQEQREDAISILLPDVQESRTWIRLLAIKARFEIAEKQWDAAARTIETGLSMSRHIGEGPFLIHGLVGIADANIFLNRVEEFISQPDAPDLYWSLTALPRPLVNLRNGMETEQILGFFVLPELSDLSMKRTPAEWSALLARLYTRWNGLVPLLESVEDRKPKKPIPSLAKFSEIVLPEAKTFMKDRGTSIEGMGDDEIILRYIATYYREFRDRTFAPTYLPYMEAVKFYQASIESRKTSTGPVSDLFGMLVPAINAAHFSEARLDRRVAALRTIEALRMQAQKDGGTLPTSLDKITLVPVPLDPLTGRPFEFRAEGDSRVLSAPSISEPDQGLSFRISTRKAK